MEKTKMKTIKIYYKNGNTLEQNVYDWELANGFLYFITRSGVDMPHPVVVSASHMAKVEEITDDKVIEERTIGEEVACRG